MLIDSDAKNDIDDQWAITYAICSPEIRVVGITAAHFNGNNSRPDSVRESYEEIAKIVGLVGKEKEIVLKKGLSAPLEMLEHDVSNEAVDFIIGQSETVENLHIVCIGALTNIAAAYLKKPKAFANSKLFWLGGGPWPTGGKEYNAMTDISALRMILASSIEFHWVIATGVCNRLNVSINQSDRFVREKGAIGEYLHQLLIQTKKESRPLYDVGPIAAIKESSWFIIEQVKAPLISNNGDYFFDGNGRDVFVYTDLQSSSIIEDLMNSIADWGTRGND